MKYKVLCTLRINKIDQATTSKTCGYFVQHGQVFDGSVVLPHPYISITCCILVLSAEKADAMLKTSAVVATSNQQLLYVENSVVKDVCQLPFMHPEDIQLVNTGRNGSLFIISFNEGHVCAVWKENFHVCKKEKKLVVIYKKLDDNIYQSLTLSDCFGVVRCQLCACG